MAECWLIGVLDDGPAGLGERAMARLRGARRVIGATRVLELCGGALDPAAQRLDLSGRLKEVPGWIGEALGRDEPVAVLATGDPLCFGIGGYLAERLPPGTLRVEPHPSTLQLAFARLALPWQGARWISVHHRDGGEWRPGAEPGHGLYPLARAVATHELLGVLTSPANDPGRIARLLLAEGLAERFEMSVAERLLRPDERLVSGLPVAELAAMTFAEPNVVVLRRRPSEPESGSGPLPLPLPLLGLADESFAQRKPERGLITKREVRAVALALLELRPGSRVWDLGAGSGSVGLEAARLCHEGHVWAVEKNAADLELIETNRRRLGVTNYTARHGRAPEACGDWPDPDAVFVGGSGGELGAIIDLALARLRPGGRLVLALVTLENLAAALERLKGSGVPWQVTQLQAARSRPILDLHRLQPENPVWLVAVDKPAGVADSTNRSERTMHDPNPFRRRPA